MSGTLNGLKNAAGAIVDYIVSLAGRAIEAAVSASIGGTCRGAPVNGGSGRGRYPTTTGHHDAAGATGAIVTSPTLSWVGEIGTEMVVPLNRMPGAMPLPPIPRTYANRAGSGGLTVQVIHNGPLPGGQSATRRFARWLAPELDSLVRAKR